MAKDYVQLDGMKLITTKPDPVPEKLVLPQMVMTDNGAQFRVKAYSGDLTEVSVGIRGAEPNAAVFTARACDQAAAFFQNLARVLRGQPQENV